MKKQRSGMRLLLFWTAIVSLAGAYLFGFIRKGREIQQLLEERIPDGQKIDRILESPTVYAVNGDSIEPFSGYYVITGAQGWGGPLKIATAVDKNGIIQETLVLDHKETPSFFTKLQKRKYFDQYRGRHVGDPFIPGEDIDTVTQATVSSKAFAQAIRNGVHSLGRRTFRLQIQEREPGWVFGYREILLIALFCGAFAACARKWNILRYLVMAVSFFFLGFILNMSLSIAQFGSLALGFFPSLKQNAFWWILLIGAIGAVLLLKNNLYCYALCPFGNLQELNSKISGINLNLHPKIQKSSRSIKRALIWLALVLIFLRQSPALGAYEPFPVLFGLQGIEIQWIILPLVILGSFVFKRYFCRFFCPVGFILNLLLKMRGRLNRALKRS